MLRAERRVRRYQEVLVSPGRRQAHHGVLRQRLQFVAVHAQSRPKGGPCHHVVPRQVREGGVRCERAPIRTILPTLWLLCGGLRPPAHFPALSPTSHPFLLIVSVVCPGSTSPRTLRVG